MNFMKRLNSKEVCTEVACPACEGTGFPKVRQPVQAGRKRCFGKGRIGLTEFNLPVTAAPGEESWNIEREEIDAGDPRGLIVQQPENTLCCEVPVFWRL
jgi:hypothetical protein